MNLKNYSTVNRVFKLISARSSFQKKKIENFYKRLNKKTLSEIERYLRVYNKFLLINNIQIQEAANCYLELCADMFNCHIKFLRTGKYPVNNLKDAKRNVYNNKKKMKSYMVGLAISQFFWETHFKMFLHLQLLIKSNVFIKNYLEIGPGHGLFSYFSLNQLKKLKEYNAIDISKTSLNLTKNFLKLKKNNDKIKKNFILGDFLNIKINKKFDLIVCGEVIEHVYNPIKFLKKINLSLSPNGKVFISTCINCPAIDHVNQWDKIDQIRSLFKISKLKILSERILPVERVSYKNALKKKYYSQLQHCTKKIMKNRVYLGKKFILNKKITQVEINKFTNLSGDRNPIHLNSSFAKAMGYGKVVAHGMLSEIYLSSIIGNKLPGPGSLWVDKQINFKKIVRVNDKLKFVAEVKEIHKTTNIVLIQINCYNQFNEVIFESKNSVIVPKNKIYSKKFSTDKKQNKKEIRINIKKKTAIVLGGSGGIGFEVVKKLLTKKFNVIAFYYSNSIGLKKISKRNNKLKIFKLDIKNEKSLNNSLKIISNLFPTHFINCYSQKIYPIELKKILKKDFDYYLKDTFFNLFKIIEICVNRFKIIGFGNIIDISSIFLKLPQKNFLPYIVYKGAMHSLIKSLAIELADFKIRANSIGAGITNTPQISDMTEKQKLVIAAKTPLQKIADPIDIANAVYFLASDDSSFITGTTIDVNGGQV